MHLDVFQKIIIGLLLYFFGVLFLLIYKLAFCEHEQFEKQKVRHTNGLGTYLTLRSLKILK